MGTTEHTVQAAGPRPSGGVGVAAFDMHDLSEQTVPLVQVTWTVVRQYQTVLPAHLWERLDGQEGPTGTGPMDGVLTDLEAEADSQVIERNIDAGEVLS